MRLVSPTVGSPLNVHIEILEFIPDLAGAYMCLAFLNIELLSGDT